MHKKDHKHTPDKTLNDNITRGRSSSVADIRGDNTFSPSKNRKTKHQPLPNDILGNDEVKRFFEECETSTVKLDKMVNSKEFSDTVFTVGGHVLYAHRSVIEVRCPTLFAVNLKDRPSKKGNISFYKIDDKLFDETTLYSILYYLYTDTVQFATLSPIDVVMLIKAAEVYELERLIWLCERYLRLVITDELFFTLLRSSSTLNVTRAKNICLEYGKNRFGDLINKRDEVNILGIELFREFVVFSHHGNVDVEDPNAKTIESTIQQDMQKIYKERHHCDCFFTFGNEKVEFHKSFLLAQSDNILKLLKSADEVQKLPKEVNMSSGAFEAALSFIYYRNLSFNSTHAAEIIPFAKEYSFQSLYEECERKIKSDINADSVIAILSLCYHKDLEKLLKKEMQDPCFKFIERNFIRIEFSVLKYKQSRMIADIFGIIKKQIKNGKWSPKSDQPNESELPQDKQVEVVEKSEAEESVKSEEEKVEAKPEEHNIKEEPKEEAPEQSSEKVVEEKVVNEETKPKEDAEEKETISKPSEPAKKKEKSKEKSKRELSHKKKSSKK